jgi:RNA-directed DNA polymerase
MLDKHFLIERIADPDNLRLAFWKAKKGKSNAYQVEAYRKNLDHNLVVLREQIITGDISAGKYAYFKIFEPKERQICAAAFSEQVLHHAIMNICHDHFEQYQIYDSYASRKGKGTSAALERAKTYTKRYEWYLKLDIRKFFDSIHHDIVKQQLRRLLKDDRLLAIMDKIIDSYEAQPTRGVPIGNLTSQYIANHYLAGLDHFIKEKLHILAYVRYMDDMVLWHNDPAVLKKARLEIQAYIEKTLLCDLKPIQMKRVQHGLPFVGYHLFPYDTRLLQQSKRRFVKKYQYAQALIKEGAWTQADFQRHVLPLFAFVKQANSRSFRQEMIGKISFLSSDIQVGQSP